MSWIIDMGMTVEGVFVSDSQIDAVSRGMRMLEAFTYAEAQKEFLVAGVDSQSTYRAADRWLQAEKKSGNISYKAKAWRWIK